MAAAMPHCKIEVRKQGGERVRRHGNDRHGPSMITCNRESMDLIVVRVEQARPPGCQALARPAEEVEQVLGDILRMGWRSFCGGKPNAERKRPLKCPATPIDEMFEQLPLDFVLVGVRHGMLGAG